MMRKSLDIVRTQVSCSYGPAFKGDTRGGWYGYGYEYGMPTAWLGTNLLSIDGYGSSDKSNLCFIGFGGLAPMLINGDSQFGGSGTLKNFLLQFYYDALYQVGSGTVNAALDYASQAVWGVSYPNCVLHKGYLIWDPNTQKWLSGAMVVYGDGNIRLKPITPLFAMKTRVDGWFYMPNKPFRYVKIEETFLDSRAEGDQVGKTVAGYPFPFPDGSVGLADQVALANAYGSSERDSKWNYQVDIVPDGKIGLSDLVVLTKNYGNQSSSWYSTDLSNYELEINFADGSWYWRYPNADGFVAIPWNCTSFQVYRNNSEQHGAFLTFWG